MADIDNENNVNFCVAKVTAYFKYFINTKQTLSLDLHLVLFFCLPVDQSPGF